MDRNGLHKAEYDQMYINTMRPIFDKKALFTDMTEDYVNPSEPSAYGEVTIKFRTKKKPLQSSALFCRISAMKTSWPNYSDAIRLFT